MRRTTYEERTQKVPVTAIICDNCGAEKPPRTLYDDAWIELSWSLLDQFDYMNDDHAVHGWEPQNPADLCSPACVGEWLEKAKAWLGDTLGMTHFGGQDDEAYSVCDTFSESGTSGLCGWCGHDEAAHNAARNGGSDG